MKKFLLGVWSAWPSCGLVCLALFGGWGSGLPGPLGGWGSCLLGPLGGLGVLSAWPSWGVGGLVFLAPLGGWGSGLLGPHGGVGGLVRLLPSNLVVPKNSGRVSHSDGVRKQAMGSSMA